jgi:predicted negative regulator of RcsB-dependent stress response
LLGVTRHFQSRFDDSLRELHQAIDSSNRNQWPVAQFAAVCAARGDRTKAHEVLSELEQRRQHEYVSALHIAAVHVQLGEQDQAFAWLDRACEERSPLLMAVKHFPFVTSDAIRSDPRFETLLGRIGMSKDGKWAHA